MPSSDFLNPEGAIQRYGDKLPHWQQAEVMQFVTFRLGDALPVSKIDHWKEQRRRWLLTYPKPWNSETELEYHRRFTWKIEAWLDRGEGSCLLGDPITRSHLSESLMRFQGEKVQHHAWVIMPNHVHLLFKPVAPLPKLIEAWKSVSARAIGRGPIWQRNYRDTLIRNEDHFVSAVRYIRKNPEKAKLAGTPFRFGKASARQKSDKEGGTSAHPGCPECNPPYAPRISEISAREISALSKSSRGAVFKSATVTERSSVNFPDRVRLSALKCAPQPSRSPMSWAYVRT